MVRGLGGGFHIWLEASGSGRRGGGKGGTGDDTSCIANRRICLHFLRMYCNQGKKRVIYLGGRITITK